MAMLALLPDILYGWTNEAYKYSLRLDELAVMSLLAFILLNVRRAWSWALMIGFMGLLQLAQLLHFAYFGTAITPYEVGLFFSEQREIWSSLSVMLSYMWWPIVLLALSLTSMTLLWWRLSDRLLRLPFPTLILLGMLALLPMKAQSTHGVQHFLPDPQSHALKNSLYAVSYYVGHDLLGKGSAPRGQYQPYRITHMPLGQPVNIVIIMGESLTFRHMGLFGYGRDTTPELNTFRSQPGFVFREAIASGVSTKVSLPMFFNVQREPDNPDHLYRYESNLFKLAKAQGLKTHFISSQTSNLTTFSGMEYVDHLITQEDLHFDDMRALDDQLLDHLKDIDLSGSNLIVLHQRNAHSPYVDNYPKAFAHYPVEGQDKRAYSVNSYDNAVHYTDHLLASLLKSIAERAGAAPAYIFFTSDHGELLGEGGKYGHLTLEQGVSEVPFIFYGPGAESAFLETIRAMTRPTHYEIGLAVARAMGVKIENPNARSGQFFVNGPDLSGAGGYQVVERRLDGTLKYLPPTLPN